MQRNTTHTITTTTGTFSRRVDRTTAIAAAVLATAALTACGIGLSGDAEDGGWTESSQAADAGLSPVLFLGDSVAAGQAVALRQGLAESGVKFVDATSTGGGNVVGPNAEERWRVLPGELEQAEGGVVIYQITTYDWGTSEEQRAAYERLAETTAEVDADLLLVSMPPILPDDFYEPHMDELASADETARQVAEAVEGVDFLDATEVWGDEYARERDGAIDRSADGIHTCPQGAARFTGWTLDQLAERYDGFVPASPATWANTGWSDSELFHGC